MMVADRIRGTIDVPLDARGAAEARRSGLAFAKRGGFDYFASSNLRRAVQTLRIVKALNGHRGEVVYIGAGLQPWPLGELEGLESVAAAPILRKLVENPARTAPGVSPSGAQGKSFDFFRVRFLKTFFALARRVPEEKRLLIVAHYRCVKLLQAWFAAGAPNDLSVDRNEMLHDDVGTADLFHVRSDGKLDLEFVDSADKLEPGVYVMRHGKTFMNR